VLHAVNIKSAENPALKHRARLKERSSRCFKFI
jgi:hypothetical protein